MKKYLTPEDPDVFIDLPILKRRTWDVEGEECEMCPTCKGHGKWHLVINAYPTHDYKHFDGVCNDCHGYGWIKIGRELGTVERQRIFDLFKPVLKRVSGMRYGYANKGTTILLTDVTLANHPDRNAALFYCADNWWSHNFGGVVSELERNSDGILYHVKVYTD